MNREVPVAFCGGLTGRFRHSTHYCLHWSLDVTFNEDNSRIHSDNAAENIAMVRHTVLNLLQIAKAKYKGSSLKGLRKKAAWGNSTLKTILEQ